MRRGLVVFVCLVGCDVRSPGAVNSKFGGGEGTDAPPGLAVEAFATPLELVAGGTTAVSCVVRRSGSLVTGATTELELAPSPSALNETEAGYTARFNRAGLYTLRCTTAGGAVKSPDLHVNVVPGTLVGIDTAVAPASARAGAPVAVTCTATDIYGNAPPETRPTAIETDPEIIVDPITQAIATVRGTSMGTYDVACRKDNLVDAVPAALTVTPGLPARSETSVTATDVAPTQTVSVSCTVTDAYGNPVSAQSSLVVMPASGNAASAGLAVSDLSFAASKTGLYYVFCAVPGYQAGDESPALVRVHPGLPCTWAYDSLDTSGCFWQGRRLPFYYEVADFWGNLVEPAPLEMAAVPSTGVTSDGQGGWIFANEGDYDLVFSVLEPHDSDGAHNCAGLPGAVAIPYIANIRVDSRGPQFTIVSPARSAMLLQGGVADVSVPISGQVTDTLSPVTALVFNGATLPVSGTLLSEPINQAQTSRWGMSAITGEATDECGNRSVLAQAYLRSGQYFAAATTPNAGARAVTGILAHLNQPVIDDGNRADLDDMASLIQAIIASINWDSLLPPGTPFASDPLRGGCSFPDTWTDYSYWVGRPNNSQQILGQIAVNYLRAVNGGMSFDIDLNGLSVPIAYNAYVRECVLGGQNTDNVSGSFRVNGNIQTDGVLGISLVGGVVDVSVPTLNVVVSNLNVSGFNLSCSGLLGLFCGLLEGLIEDAINAALDAFEAQIATMLRNELMARMPPMVEDFLNSFALNTGFDIPPPVNMTLNLSSGLDRVVFSGPEGTGWGELGLYTQVYPSARGGGIPATARGGIRKDGALPTFSATAYDFGMGLKDDLINQMLWALWYGGGLDLPDVTSMLGGTGVEGVNMAFYAGLPPVIMPGCAPNAQVPSCSGEQIDIGFGDVFVDASVDLGMLLSGTPGAVINVGMYLTMIAGASIDIDPTVNELLVAVSPDPLIYVQVVTIDDPGYQALMSDLFSRLLAIVAPNLVASVLGSFPIPEFDLAGIVPPCSDYLLQANCPSYCTWNSTAVPPEPKCADSFDSTWSLTNGSIVRAGDYYRLTGSLQ